MSTWTTYFSVVDQIDSWVDTPNAIDNNISTFATTATIGLKTMILDTPAAVNSVGAISKVEIRIYCSLGDLGVPVKIRFTPRFLGGNGDPRTIAQNLSWTSWYDVTGDANAPGTWAWSDITAIGANVIYYWGSGPAPLAQVGSVEIKVTYAGISTYQDKSTLRNYYY